MVKKSILDNEIIYNQSYKIFRRDRPSKFVTDTGATKVGGGGVLIGIRSDLEIESNTIKTIKNKCSTELLAIEIKFRDGTKMCIATYYRTRDMKDQNHNIIDRNLKALAEKYGKLLLVGDINLPTVNWHQQSSSNGLETKFINSFNDIGFEQLILEPTHKLSNTLDLLLTTCPHMITDLNVDPLPICGSSDHSTITFNISKKAYLSKVKRRKLYNFKKANWTSLNLELSHINWKKVICHKDIHTAWRDFKFVLNYSVNKYIPTITSKSRNQPPW